MNAKGLFITGTDTGVGKTWVCCRLIRVLIQQGIPVCPLKPVASGATLHGSEWLSEDTLSLMQASGIEHPQQITGWTFREPAAPPVAARAEGKAISLDQIQKWIQQQTTPDHFTLIEGVGGLLCPLTETETVADLAVRLGLPLVVVARRSLGTINHTLLTLEAARAWGLHVAAILVNETQPSAGIADQTAPEQIRHRGQVPQTVVLPFADPQAAEEILSRIDWHALADFCSGL